MLAVPDEAVAHLADGAPLRVRVGHELHVLPLGQSALRLQPPLAVVEPSAGQVEDFPVLARAAPDPDLLILLGPQVDLLEVLSVAARQRLQRRGIRIVDQEAAADLKGHGLSQGRGDLRDQVPHLVFKPVQVLDDPEIGMSLPGSDHAVIQRDGLLRRLIADGVGLRPVVDSRVLGRRLQVKDRVIAAELLVRVHTQLPQGLVEFRLRHVGPVVKKAPVADDEDLGPAAVFRLLLRGSRGNLLRLHLFQDVPRRGVKNLFFFQLELHLEELIGHG